MTRFQCTIHAGDPRGGETSTSFNRANHNKSSVFAHYIFSHPRGGGIIFFLKHTNVKSSVILFVLAVKSRQVSDICTRRNKHTSSISNWWLVTDPTSIYYTSDDTSVLLKSSHIFIEKCSERLRAAGYTVYLLGTVKKNKTKGQGVEKEHTSSSSNATLLCV